MIKMARNGCVAWALALALAGCAAEATTGGAVERDAYGRAILPETPR